MKTKNLLLALVILTSTLFFISGCATPLAILGRSEIGRTYPATKLDLKWLNDYWFGTPHSGQWGFDLSGQIWLTPITIVDLPFAAVTDTILWPYDAYSVHRDTADTSFWKMVLSKNDTSLPIQTYKDHLSTKWKETLWNKVYRDKNDPQLSPEWLYIFLQLSIDSNGLEQQSVSSAFSQTATTPEDILTKIIMQARNNIEAEHAKGRYDWRDSMSSAIISDAESLLKKRRNKEVQ